MEKQDYEVRVKKKEENKEKSKKTAQ